MRIKEPNLTIEFGDVVGDRVVRVSNSNKAVITVSFTVDLDAMDMELIGGFGERVSLSGSNVGPGLDPLSRGGNLIQLPLGQAIKRSGVSVDKWDLYRERRYIAPRYPYPREPFTEARFKAYIEIAPRQILHDEKVMEGVLPARYPVSPSSALSGVERIARRLRYVFGR